MNSVVLGGQWLKDLNSDLSGSDRACAVLAGALLDDRLMNLLKTYLVPSEKPNDDKLFSPSGALGSFSARIELCRRLNLIDDKTRLCLDLIRKIRNDAAHKHEFDFIEQSTSDKVELILSKLEVKVIAPTLLRTPYDSPKGHFVVTIILLICGLELEHKHTNQTNYTPTFDYSNVHFVEK
ncbi:MAG: DUF4145 domain-containing protein [Desulfuromonadaceae bacterium]|nr:DUF4145 domain-containing protein [Desulfuromonadaceae bacterium]